MQMIKILDWFDSQSWNIKGGIQDGAQDGRQ